MASVTASLSFYGTGGRDRLPPTFSVAHHAREIVKLKRASRATLTATDATGSHSNARAVTFRIVRR